MNTYVKTIVSPNHMDIGKLVANGDGNVLVVASEFNAIGRTLVVCAKDFDDMKAFSSKIADAGIPALLSDTIQADCVAAYPMSLLEEYVDASEIAQENGVLLVPTTSDVIAYGTAKSINAVAKLFEFKAPRKRELSPMFSGGINVRL